MARRRAVQPETPIRPASGRVCIAVAILGLMSFTVLAFGNLLSNSPTSDETTHLVSGYSYLIKRDYRLNPEHPPLLKMVAALPLLRMNIWPANFTEAADGRVAFRAFHEAWALSVLSPALSQWRVSEMLLYGLRDRALTRAGKPDAIDPPSAIRYERPDYLNDAERLFLPARVMMLTLGIALAVAIFTWSYSLWGLEGATLSLLLFCFDPNFIAHSGLITTDVGAALCIFLALYFFWRVCQRFSVVNVLSFASAVALAQVTKFSAVLLAPMLVVAAIAEVVGARGRRKQQMSRVLAAGALSLVVTVGAIWAVYGFRFNAVPDPGAALEEHLRAQATLTQPELDNPEATPTGHLPVEWAVRRWAANSSLAARYPQGYGQAEADAALRHAPTSFTHELIRFAQRHELLPEAYLFGLAWVGATSVMKSAYLDGEYSALGFRSFFLWTFLYKTPVVIIVITVLGLVWAIRDGVRGEGAFLVWPPLVFAVIAIGSRVNIGHRHVFPLMPFVYVLAGAAAVWSLTFVRRRMIAIVTISSLVFSVLVVLSPRPRVVVNEHLSYINELGGGPVEGWARLSDSNFDWGQDLRRLAVFLRDRGIDEPVWLIYFGNAEPSYYGIRYHNLRLTTFPTPDKPGYVAISQMDLLGVIFPTEARYFWRDYLNRARATLVGRAGCSIFVYRVDNLPARTAF